jgi:O-antigen ligase
MENLILLMVGILVFIFICLYVDKLIMWFIALIFVIIFIIQFVKITGYCADLEKRFIQEIELLKPGENMNLGRFDTFPACVYQIPKEKSLSIGNISYVIEKIDQNSYALYSSSSYILYVKFEPILSSSGENLRLVQINKQFKKQNK